MTDVMKHKLESVFGTPEDLESPTQKNDHNEPATAEWLKWERSSKFDNTVQIQIRGSGTYYRWHIPTGNLWACYNYADMVDDHTVFIGTYKTRGEFLALCRALRIPMEG